jgi:hypothetical protein
MILKYDESYFTDVIMGKNTTTSIRQMLEEHPLDVYYNKALEHGHLQTSDMGTVEVGQYEMSVFLKGSQEEKNRMLPGLFNELGNQYSLNYHSANRLTEEVLSFIPDIKMYQHLGYPTGDLLRRVTDLATGEIYREDLIDYTKKAYKYRYPEVETQKMQYWYDFILIIK